MKPDLEQNRARLKCALCLYEVRLQRSHIIPEFLYKRMYDDKHRFHILSAVKELDDKMAQKGFRENLLCEKCETKLSRWEDYACKAIYGGKELTIEKIGRVIEVRDVDYAKMKLFQLSILWRAGVSKLEFFKRVDLGIHEERLRQMLLLEQPGQDYEYGCLVFGLTDYEGNTASELIVQPNPVRMGSHNGYRFVFGGFSWNYVVTSHRPKEPFTIGFLTTSGIMRFIRKNIFEADFMREFGEQRSLQRKVKVGRGFD